MLTGTFGTSCIFRAVSFRNAPLLLESFKVSDDDEVRRFKDNDFAIAIVTQRIRELQRVEQFCHRLGDIKRVFVFVIIGGVVAVASGKRQRVATVVTATTG